MAALAAKAATTTIPILFGAGGDPVPGRAGSLMTWGQCHWCHFTSPVAKRMQLLRELVPKRSSWRMMNLDYLTACILSTDKRRLFKAPLNLAMSSTTERQETGANFDLCQAE
jgi:hypothetical protein